MAPPGQALHPRARPRRGSVERPVNARLVRGTWLLVALPLLLTAFSVARPQPCRRRRCRDLRRRDRGAAGTRARTRLSRPVARRPWKPRGSGVGRRAVRLWLRPPGRPLHGADPGRGEVELQNLVTVVRGGSQRTIVITAHRDNSGEGPSANDNASGTGALIELAVRTRRSAAPLSPRRSLRTRSSSSPPTAAPSARSARPGSRRARPTARTHSQ